MWVFLSNYVRPQAIAEAESPGLYAILFQGVGAAACAAEATLVDVEVEDDFFAGFEVAGVVGVCEIICCKVAGGAFHWGIGDDEKAVGVRFEGEPADVGVVAVFLWHDIWDVLVGDGALVITEGCASFAIPVVFMRATAKIAELFQARAKGHGGADAGYVWEAMVGMNGVGNVYVASGEDTRFGTNVEAVGCAKW